MVLIFRDSPHVLEEKLGIPCVFLGKDRWGCEAIITLEDAKKAIIQMVKDEAIQGEEGEKIYETIMQMGVSAINIQALVEKAISMALPEGFQSNWEIRWEFCEEHSVHGTLVNEKLGVELEEVVDGFFPALEACSTFYDRGEMTAEEASYILREVNKAIPFGEDDTDDLAENESSASEPS